MKAFSYSVFAQGGPVMWLLMALGVAALVVFAERALYLHRSQIRSAEFLNGIKNLLQKDRLMEALTLCEETPGPIAKLVKAGLRHAGEDEQALRFAVQEAALTELPVLERRVGALAAIAQIAPLLGLLGTLLGMIQTFWLFNQGGNYATPAVLAGGMWEALLTAAAGLAVAIPAHLGRHFLTGRVRVLVHDMEWIGNELMRYLLRDYRKGGGTGV
ncbi:MotA/TolQ/ExbB proton channel family protein [Oleiharenicola lentus]|uniref:MotA/TolQ/ExbB proton channel family protein n=1 Tax=Oleiharenicola lentus TaxID=2508720 RepID=A0A4Q1C4A2_9BACT|nr:MotA/TolQ/ExbB proton channel family protein [Oleiharenicola lentus]RXK53079.1 MotA/TolQ/ExbB proton channel family protein [Oleiharenicola lentus]